MKVKKISVLFLSSIMMLELVGCASTPELAALNEMESFPVESEVTEDYNLSYSEEQDMIYSQVADRQLLDLTVLTKCSDNELQEVINYMDAVDAQLVGTASTSLEETIDSCFTNYLLCAFEETPYYWQRTETIVRGIDAESRSIIVDVTYKTIDFEKKVQVPSAIPLGCQGYELKLKNRLERWLAILEKKTTNEGDLEWQQEMDEFEKYYGKFEDIYDSQNNMTLTEQIYETGNQKTYDGMIDTDAEQSTGRMTVRYVLVPNYKLGINLGLTCQHMYILNYQLDKDVTENMSIFTDEGYDTVTDSVYNLIYSYFQCIDENNFTGLYKLTTDFGKLDKHFEELFETTYLKHENFTISLFDIQGTHITCGIEINVKKRAKGSKMTYPIYKDRYFCELELVDDALQVKNMVLLSSTLEGEPTIKTKDADVLGFANTIDLDNDDKIAIEKLIYSFSILQLQGDVTSDNFGAVVDNSMSQSNSAALKKAMLSLGGARKVVWISNYQQGTKNYASVKCTELFQQSDNSIIEASSLYDFIRKGDEWYVFDYNINSSVRLGTTNLNTAGCLCLVSPEKVEQYTSQVKGTESNVENDNLVSDVSVKYSHDEYTPKIKSGTQELGLDTEQAYDLEETEYNATLSALLAASGTEVTSEEFIMAKNVFLTHYEEFLDSIDANEPIASEGEEGEGEGESEEGESSSNLSASDFIDLFDVTRYLDDAYKEVVAVYYNKLNNRYESETVLKTVGAELEGKWNSHSSQISASLEKIEGEKGEALRKEFASITNALSTAIGQISE